MADQSKKQRVYRGNAPEDGTIVSTLGEWTLYARPPVHEDWSNYKLVSGKPRAQKANYHFSYSPRLKRFARSNNTRGLLTLRDYEPAVYAWVCTFLGVPGSAPAAKPVQQGAAGQR